MLETTVFGDTESTADDEFVAGPSGFVEYTVAEPSTSKPTKRTSNRAVSGIPTKRKPSEDKGKSGMKGVPKYPCGICKKECKNNVVGCDRCDSWFHSGCINVINLDDLPDEWFCEDCSNQNQKQSIFFAF